MPVMGNMKWKCGLKHGHCLGGNLSPTYRSFIKMKSRCNDRHGRWAPFYHMKGITVCERWNGRGAFQRFLADMGERPEGRTMERIDNNAGYSPENCRWGTWRDQSNNRSVSVKITHNGITQSMEQWARELNVCSKSMHYFLRVKKLSLKAYIDRLKTVKTGSTYQDRRSIKQQNHIGREQG